MINMYRNMQKDTKIFQIMTPPLVPYWLAAVDDTKQQEIVLEIQQTWKKLQAVQVALADILSEITLFWGQLSCFFFSEEGGRRVGNWELRFNKAYLR